MPDFPTRSRMGNSALFIASFFLALVGCFAQNGVNSNLSISFRKASICPSKGKKVNLRISIRLERVRRCRNRFFFCKSVVDNRDYEVFGRHGMSTKNQRKVYITTINKPARTKNIVFVVAGQQFRSNILRKYGDPSGVTGQPRGYAKGFKRRTVWRYSRISANGLLYKILKTGYFSLSNTFVSAVFDARFNFEFLDNTKGKIENGYYHYLLQRLKGNTPGTIYLAGSSRGGCLVFRLAARLIKQFANARIIVHSYDGVCKTGLLSQGEFGVKRRPVRRNPYNKRYFVYHSDMNARFSNRKCLSIMSFLSGEPPGKFKGFWKYWVRVRAFGHLGFARSNRVTNRLVLANGFPWYTETFYNDEHLSITWKHHEVAVAHFEKAMRSLPCSCGR